MNIYCVSYQQHNPELDHAGLIATLKASAYLVVPLATIESGFVAMTDADPDRLSDLIEKHFGEAQTFAIIVVQDRLESGEQRRLTRTAEFWLEKNVPHIPAHRWADLAASFLAAGPVG